MTQTVFGVLIVLATVDWTGVAQQPRRGSLIVMFDVSASMRLGERETEPFLAAVRDGLLARLTPADRVLTGAFASEIRLVSSDQEPTNQNQLDGLRQAVTGEPGWRYGPSRLWDAVTAAVARVANAPLPRVVVVVTDGEASGNESSSADVAEKLRNHNVSLWAVSVRAGLGDSRLRAFTLANRGRIFTGYVSRQPDPQRRALATALAEVLDAFRKDGSPWFDGPTSDSAALLVH